MGGVERHIYQLRHTMERALESDDSLSMHDACDVACMAANFEPMADRTFSPQQLVYGLAAPGPNFVSADLPPISSSGVPADHVGHYMTRFLHSVYTAGDKFNAADIRTKVSSASRHQPSRNRDWSY